jgi:GT2 family glycosyltransferase
MLEGMDERFQWCFDDVDLCLRIGQELRKKCVVSSKAILTHFENYSTLKNPTNLKPSFPAAFELLKQKYKGQLRADLGDYKLDLGRYNQC